MKRLLSVFMAIAVLSAVSGDALNVKSQKIKFWLPHPFENPNQSVIKTDFQVPGSYSLIDEQKHNNKIIYGTYQNKAAGLLKVSATYEVERKERLTALTAGPSAQQTPYPSEVLKYLEPSRYAAVTPRIKKLAREITAGKKTDLSKAKAVYDYVLKHMEYNKTAPGWGRGDSERACIIAKGNCTDFHSLFNSLIRAVNIPAKFVIGFPIPNQKQAEVKGYHCWAEFYLAGYGWVPVDISEAWKNKSKRDYYFGNLAENRIGFTVGRDITLDPEEKDLALNYFIYPHVEIDGVATADIEKTFKSELL